MYNRFVPDHRFSTLNGRALSAGGRAYRERLSALMAAVILGGIAWLVSGYAGGLLGDASHRLSGMWALAGLAMTHTLISAFLFWGLAFIPLSRAWRYRGSFLVSAGVGLIRSILPLFTALPVTSPLLPLAAAGGAFLGSLVVTAWQEGLFENNQPPSPRIQREVLTRHRDLIGSPPAEKLSKRLFDVSLAGLGLVLSAPVWLVSVFLIWFENPGPVLFIKNSVGIGGVNFHQYKLRTMVSDAEGATGPVLSGEEDARVLRIGGFLRKTALDELPQLLNILRGEMSFVGPRPQRTVLVNDYLQEIQGYAERHRVLPGLAGLAQVAGDYYLTPRQKLRYDRLYTRHASLAFDLKLLALAFMLVFWLRWSKDWDGRLPRRWLRLGSS